MNKYITALSLLFCVSFASMQAAQLTVQYKEFFTQIPKYVYVSGGVPYRDKIGSLDIYAKDPSWVCSDVKNLPIKSSLEAKINTKPDNSGDIFMKLYDSSWGLCDVKQVDFDIDITKPIKGTVAIPQGNDHIIVTIYGDGRETSVERK
jgi:hypothetical protein